MKFHLTWNVWFHEEGVVEEQCGPGGDLEGRGMADAMVVCSLIYPPDEMSQCAFVSMNGKTGEPLPARELFKVWAMLAHLLSEDESLGPKRREFCRQAFEAIQEAIGAQPPVN